MAGTDSTDPNVTDVSEPVTHLLAASTRTEVERAAADIATIAEGLVWLARDMNSDDAGDQAQIGGILLGAAERVHALALGIMNATDTVHLPKAQRP